ncbi:hypothetical protein GW17_00044241 [Ensete ventricosum]|nr:hypothetical protein GW17_00044241 [Ensete ventricosum]RZR95931.1 hypothetical protein BHM03_00024896 [Ensete ventricosum]
MGDLSRWQRVMVHVAHERPLRDSMGIFHATSLTAAPYATTYVAASLYAVAVCVEMEVTTCRPPREWLP